MAQSPTSQSRAQLIREMARDLNRTRPSSRSSKGSQRNADLTTSTFDPDNEAMMSTQRLDHDNTTQQLPELRASAKKYGRYNRPEPDFAIDTSALGRAFPDFTQAGPSSSDGNSLSIEHGRGPGDADNGKSKRPGRSRDFSSNNDDYSKEFSPLMVGNHQVMYTPPMTRPKASKRVAGDVRNSNFGHVQVRRASALQKEVTEPSPPIEKATDYGSGGSRKASAEQRRTLASMHARVTDEDAASDITDGRPPTLNLTTRSTRFSGASNAKAQTTTSLPPKFTSKQSFTRAQPEATVQAQSNQTVQTNTRTLSSVNPDTAQQSFILPDMPNMSELVSGFFQDGTPVFSRQGKSVASRFASGSHIRQDGRTGPDYNNVGGLLTPEDEKAIILSLNILQDKVAELELEKAEAQADVQDLQDANRALEREKAEMKRLRRSDSALGTTDGSDGGLESTIRTLQEQVDSAHKKRTVSDIAVKNVIQERDSAVAQLSVAYLTTEQLKAENEQLSQENRRLLKQLAQFITIDNDDTHASIQVDNNQRTEPQRQALSEPQSLIETGGDHQNTAAQNTRRAASSRFSRREASQVDSQQQSRVSTVHTNSVPPPETSSGAQIDHGRRKRVKKTRMVLEEYSESEKSDDSLHESRIVQSAKPNSYLPQEAEDADASKDLTMLSFLETGDIAKLRKTLEEERIARKQGRGLGSKPSRSTDDVSGPAPVDTTGSVKEPVLPRKSSLKSTAGRSSRRGDDTFHTQTEFDQTTRSNVSTANHRRHSEQSLLEIRQQRQGRGMEDMTSAFILPDITMRHPGIAEEAAANLSAAAQPVVDPPAPHNTTTCTVCQRVLEHASSPHHHDLPIPIPTPIPVSDRAPASTPYDEEPTIRPAQPPPLALATVLKALEDELAHLKMTLARHQARYQAHDATLGRRRRRATLDAVATLLRAVDAKADQVYQLYDVLEGQKAAGQVLGEEAVEATLQSLGIDVEGLGLGLRGGEGEGDEGVGVGENQNGDKGEGRKRYPWEGEGEDESEGELPWEGIETTIETTGGSASRRRRSWGA